MSHSMILGVPVLRCYDLLLRLVASAEAGSMRPEGYIVVDNGGQIGEHELPTNTKVISPGKNIGAAGAWNAIIEASHGDVLICNDDIVLGRDTVKAVEQTPGAVVFGLPKGPYGAFLHRKEALEKVGWFDENFYPYYFEDNDYERRVLLAGMKSVDAADTGCLHDGSATLKRATPEQTTLHHEQFRKNLAYYLAKWGGEPGKEQYEKAFDWTPPTKWSLRRPWSELGT